MRKLVVGCVEVHWRRLSLDDPNRESPRFVMTAKIAAARRRVAARPDNFHSLSDIARETRNQKAETRRQKPEGRNQKAGTRKREPEARRQNPETEALRPESRNSRGTCC
jgi:hypothetical protein